jgi:hypothetical protein
MDSVQNLSRVSLKLHLNIFFRLRTGLPNCLFPQNVRLKTRLRLCFLHMCHKSRPPDPPSFNYVSTHYIW